MLQHSPLVLGTRTVSGAARWQFTRSTLVVLLWLCSAGVIFAGPSYRDYIVKLPSPYRLADGSILNFTKFKGTRVNWGTCTDENNINEINGSAMACSWCDNARLTLPPNREICIQAVVIDLDGSTMGHSDPVRINTHILLRNPNAPILLKFFSDQEN